MMEAVIFDLDDTLVASAGIRELREAKQWDEVATRLPQIERYPGTLELLHYIRAAGARVGIVTSSPKWYAEQLIALHGFPVDAVIAAGDYTYGKPSREPMKAALTALEVRRASDTLAVGDRCVDTASAFAADIPSVGALWGAANPRDLMISWPEYLANTSEDVGRIFDSLCTVPKPTEGIGKKHGWLQTMRRDYLWRTNPAGDYRMHLTGVYDYIHARYKYRATWSGSYTNSMIRSFKSTATNQRFFKGKAAAQFARELAVLIPDGAFLTYVLPSKKKGDDGYDDRFELLANCLRNKTPNSIWPICAKTSTAAAHNEDANSELRDPEFIKANLEWESGIPEHCDELYIVDDVLTKGGHFRAYADFVRQTYPQLPIKCVAWALHTSTPWYVPEAT